jgi:hypothetical protein
MIEESVMPIAPVHAQKSMRLLAAPEMNLFLFAFLLNFVYEVWQSPFYEFYKSPSLGEKVIDLTHCSFGDAMIILFSGWGVSALERSRHWIFKPGWRLTLLFTSIGLGITLVIETYRVNVSRSYGGPRAGDAYPGHERTCGPAVDRIAAHHPLSSA